MSEQSEVLQRIAEDLVPDGTGSESALRAIAISAMERFIEHSTSEDVYEQRRVQSVRDNVREVARKIRVLADDVDRLAEGVDAERIFFDLTTLLAWGFSDLKLENISAHILDLRESRSLKAQGRL